MKSPGGLSVESEGLSSVAGTLGPSQAATWLVTMVVPLQTLTRLVLGGTNLCLLNYLYPEHGE